MTVPLPNAWQQAECHGSSEMTLKTDVPCHNSTLKNPHCSIARIDKYRSKFAERWHIYFKQTYSGIWKFIIIKIPIQTVSQYEPFWVGFFSFQIRCHLLMHTTFGISLCFFVQNGSLNHRSPIRLISFLENIRYNMQIRLQSDIHVRYSLEVTIVSLFQFFNSTVHLELLSVICPKWRCKSPISNQVDVISREKKPIRYNMQIRLQSDIHVRYSLEISIVSLFQFFNSTACF